MKTKIQSLFPEPEKKKSLATLKEIQDFCVEQGLEIEDGTYCFYNWQQNEWTINNKPLKKWRMAIMAWKAAGYLPSQRQRFIRKKSQPSAHDVRRVIRERRDGLRGLRDEDKKAAWEEIFRRELQCSYEEAMKVLE